MEVKPVCTEVASARGYGILEFQQGWVIARAPLEEGRASLRSLLWYNG